ncbi:low temperature requirement protein A [Novosphingobium sp. FKTRR1]|uniref:low temperature requirement protein A n=1 Tax=unclassified Novosphingobium TaxID=2644732 RepID=UPI001CEFF63A|nr:low temperature requirement protein A [Novosphingobium sp. FKTRR1]
MSDDSGPAPLPSASPRAGSLLRNHHGGHAQVSYIELFFDLVYVFAITQVSHTLHQGLDALGLARTALLFFAVWWAWIYTVWAANWADPARTPVRIMLLAGMLASLLIAVALPEAFGHGAQDRGALFVGAYVTLQIGRTLFMAWAMGRENPAGMRNMLRITAWFALSAPFWLMGALADPAGARLGWWLAAVAIEYAGPLAWFRTPGLGRSVAQDWDISGAHMAERGALFVLIALGEGIVATGASFAALPASPATTTAFVINFAGSALMWWIYFAIGAERGAEHIAGHAEAGKVARSAYTYLHMPIAGGIVVTAVADALLLAEPNVPATTALIATQCGGTVLFLVGTGLFKRFASPHRNFPLSHLIGVGGLALLALAARPLHLSAGALAASVVVALLIVALWEWRSFHGGWRRAVAADPVTTAL